MKFLLDLRICGGHDQRMSPSLSISQTISNQKIRIKTLDSYLIAEILSPPVQHLFEPFNFEAAHGEGGEPCGLLRGLLVLS